MSESPSPDNQQLPNLELFVEYIRSHNKTGDDEKIKLAKKIFFETYSENIQEGMNQKDALHKAIMVAFCFLIESHK
jgi:hypothetical protein